MSVLLISSFLVFSGALLQNSHFLLGGVKPNIVLVAIIAFSLVEKDWLRRAVVTLLGSSILIIEPTLGLETLLVVAIFFLAILAIDTLPWQGLVNGVVSVLGATVLFNIAGFQIYLFSLEVLYNISLLLLLLIIFNLLRKQPR